jgi:O-antigen ligase
MNPSLASLIYTCGIAGLFYLDRDKSIRTSKALWLPVAYLWILGSRPLSVWLGMGPANRTNTLMEGSPVDGVFFQILFIAAICVLVVRGRRVVKFLNTNFPLPILLYLVFCLFSIIWSDYPGVALKKWTKSVEDLVMVLVIVTDEQPVAALRRLFSRLGFILLPYSLLLIKYYPGIGRFYGAWDGTQMNTGVTQDKNMLGVITLVLSLGAAWRFLALLSGEETPPNRRRHLLAQGTILFMGVWILMIANSATSLVSFIVGAGLLLATRFRLIRSNPATVYVLVILFLVTVSSLFFLGGRGSVAHALGRQENLARTDIWEAVIPMAPNPLVGAGFESFWLGERLERLAQLFPNLNLNEAHDGYIEVYLNLGWVGIVLIGLILIDGFRRGVKAFRREPALGGLLLAYVLTATTYNITEAGFRMLNPFWFFLILALLEASAVAAGIGVGAAQLVETSPDRPAKLRITHALALKPDKRPMAGKVVRGQER